MAEEGTPAELDYDDALAGAVDHVSETIAAQKEAEERQKPRSRIPMFVAALAALALVAGWNVWLVVRPPPTPPAAVLEAGLRWEVGQLVLEIEAHRAAQGRLPDPSEIADLLDEIVAYSLTDGGYVVVAEEGQVRLEYDGSVPIERWMAGSGGSD